jgi:hypothetical protein
MRWREVQGSVCVLGLDVSRLRSMIGSTITDPSQANQEGKMGVHPCYVGDLPPQCAALNWSKLAGPALAVKGGLEGDRQAIMQAVALDPLTSAMRTLDQIHRIGLLKSTLFYVLFVRFVYSSHSYSLFVNLLLAMVWVVGAIS